MGGSRLFLCGVFQENHGCRRKGMGRGRQWVRARERSDTVCRKPAGIRRARTGPGGADTVGERRGCKRRAGLHGQSGGTCHPAGSCKV